MDTKAATFIGSVKKGSRQEIEWIGGTANPSKPGSWKHKLYELMQQHTSVDAWYDAAKQLVPKGKGPLYTLQIAADKGLVRIKHASGEAIQAQIKEFRTRVRRIGNSLGVILPREMLGALGVSEGDSLAVRTPEGLRITAYDPHFAAAIQSGRRYMSRYRNAMRELARR